MNLLYVKTYLEELIGSATPAYYDSRIKELIEKIDYELNLDTDILTSTQILKTVNEYNHTYLALTIKFTTIPEKDNTNKTYAVQEILAVLSGVSHYLNMTLERYNLDGGNTHSDFHKSLRKLSEKLRDFKEDKIMWSGLLKSLTTEKSFDETQRKFIMYKSKLAEKSIDK